MVPGGVVGLDAERVVRAAGEPAEGVARQRGQPDLVVIQKDVVTLHADVVERRAPKSGDARLGRGCGGEVAGSGRRECVGARLARRCGVEAFAERFRRRRPAPSPILAPFA
jgi:hypothetical protein